MFRYDLENTPVLYYLLKSLSQYEKDDVPENRSFDFIIEESRKKIFKKYPLSATITKKDFETMILTHFINRRIEYETGNLFIIKLNARLNEIMPKYNMLLDALGTYNFFEQKSGTIEKTDDDFWNKEKHQRDLENTKTGEHTEVTDFDENIDTRDNQTEEYINNSTVNKTFNRDLRQSDTPQNRLSDVRDGSYVSAYEYEQGIENTTTTENGTDNISKIGNQKTDSGTEKNGDYTDNFTESETLNIERNGERDIYKTIDRNDNTDLDKIYKNLEEINHIMDLIYKDLDILFLATN